MSLTFIGSKGGSRKTASPTRTPDNLRSEDYFEMILALCEGPIKGPVDGLKSEFLGNTALQNVDGDNNFAEIDVTLYAGDEIPDYKIKPKLGGFSSSTTVNTELDYAVPVVRQTTTGDADYIDFRVVIGQLFKQNDDGVFNGQVSFTVELKPRTAVQWANYANVAAVVAEVLNDALLSDTLRGGNFKTSDPLYLYDAESVGTLWDAAVLNNPHDPTVTLSGKTTSTYVKEFRLPTIPIDDVYDLRITKTTPNSTTTEINQVTWESFQTIISAGVWDFPGTVIKQISGRASNQFQSIPDISGIYDLKLVRVPSNYDPITRTYDGIWDGTFKIDWTDNPAWIVYDLVTNNRYGMSAFSPVIMDKASVYEAAVWCDQIMPNGRPRYTFNGLIAEPRPVREMVRYIAGAFNAVFFDDQNGTAYLYVDKDDPAEHLFAEENTIDGFRYSYSDLNTRYNDITVTFINPDLNWQEDRVRVTDPELDDFSINGRVPTDYIAVGCTNREEAIRRGRYKLITGLTECTTVTFRTNRLGQFVRPWSVILISDPKMGWGLSGRVTSISENRRTITMRDPMYLEAGIGYVAKFYTPSGVIERTIISPVVGNNYSLTLDSALPADLPEFCTFALEQEGGGIGVPKPFRVMSVNEIDGHPDQFEIVALEINRAKWAYVDGEIDAEAPQYSFLPDPLAIPGPTSVSFLEKYIDELDEFHLVVSPVLDRSLYRYYSGEFEVWSRPAGTTEQWVQRVVHFGDTIINHPVGEFEFKILPKNILGHTAALHEVDTFEYEVDHIADPPDEPIDLMAEGGIRQIRLSWILPNIRTLEAIEIYENLIDDRDTAYKVGEVKGSVFIRAGLPPAATRYYWIRARDRNQNHSDWNAEAGTSATTNLMTASDFDDYIINTAKFAQGIEPVQLVATLPNPVGYTGPKTVFNTTDGKLYTYDETTPGWKTAGASSFSDLSGTIDLSQFSQTIRPLEVVNALPATGNFDGRMVFLTADKKIYRYDAATGSWRKDVDGADIKANSITAGQIAAGAIGASEIAAGALTIGKFAPGEAWSLNRSFSTDFSDVSRWVRVLGNGTFTSESVADSQVGGKVGRATGYCVMEWPDNIPFDPSRLYRIAFKVRMTTAPSDPTKNLIYLGVTGVAADGTTRVNINGEDTITSQAYVAARGLGLSVGTAWGEYVGYFKGTAATGDGGPNANAAVPAKLHSNVRFIRPLFYLNYSGGDGVMEIDSLAIDIIEIPDGVIGVTQIKDGAITTDKIAANSITSSHLQSDSVTAGKIAAGAVGASEIAAGAIAAGHLVASNLITKEAQIVDGLITNAKIQNGAITSAKIADGQITNAKIENSAITSAKIGDLQVENAKIADATIAGQKIQDFALSIAQFSTATGPCSAGQSVIAINLAINTSFTNSRFVVFSWFSWNDYNRICQGFVDAYRNGVLLNANQVGSTLFTDFWVFTPGQSGNYSFRFRFVNQSAATVTYTAKLVAIEHRK